MRLEQPLTHRSRPIAGLAGAIAADPSSNPVSPVIPNLMISRFRVTYAARSTKQPCR